MKKNKNKFNKLLKTGILFFGISLLLWNCEKEEFLQNDSIYKTVSIEESLSFLNYKTSLNSKGTSNLQLSIALDSAKHESLINSKEKITVIPATTRYNDISSRVLLMKIKGVINTVLFQMIKEDTTKLFTGRVSINKLDGTFISGYRINEGVITTKFTKNLNSTKLLSKSAGTLCKYHADGDPNCMFTNTTIEVDLGTFKSKGGSFSVWSIFFDENPYVGNSTEEWEFENSSNRGGGGNDSSTNCTGGKIKNATTGVCECPAGYTEDANGVCVKKPCVGDPVKNPEIVSSGSSGKKGGTFGCTRSQADEICGGVKGKKQHDGLDIKATVNTPTFSMYDGIVSDARDTFYPGKYKENSYGNYILVTTKINGKTVFIKYNHLNKVNVKKGDKIKAGQIIGLNGNTGNANSPTGNVIPHIHIQVYDVNWKSINPELYLKTKFDQNKNAIPNTNC